MSEQLKPCTFFGFDRGQEDIACFCAMETQEDGSILLTEVLYGEEAIAAWNRRAEAQP